MCSLCGVLVDRGHWTESSSNPEVFQTRNEKHTWHRERQDRARLTNRILRHYGLSLSDWSGNSYILRNRTGKSAILSNLSELWAEAEKLSKTACDPLDPDLLDYLSDQ